MARIVVDPGHGGATTIQGDSTWNNAVGPNGTLEKNLTLDIGLRVEKILRDGGHDVRLTRGTDVNLRLRDRAKVARDLRAHAFVSIHFNGSTGHNAQGTETLVHTNFSQASGKLSLKVQDALLAVTGLTDRNKTFNPSTRIKPQSLGVLRPDFHDSATAACLAEVSFLDRADQETKLGNQTYRQNIAKAIAAGTEAFTGAAVAAPPVASLDVGDAIEVAAMQAGVADAETFLELASVPANLKHPPEAGTADLTENAGKPSGLFSKSFVNNTGPALALITGAAPWEHLIEFVTFIEKLQLAHFAPDEFLFLGASNGAGKCKGRNTFPPKTLWKNIKNTALMLDAIRKELGAPIRILSCYRSEAYNTCIGGENASLHMKFNAIDFTCSQGTPEIWRRVADKFRSSDPHFMGGIGVYPSSHFVHIDTRGTEANWSGT